MKMMVGATLDLNQELKKFFGFDQFKSTQKEVVQSLMDGRDTFVIMPTGGGKSLCYQLPALLLPGCAIVISPLIALMKNQVDSIRSYGNSDEIAHFLNSSLNKGQMKQVKEDIVSGKTKMLFIAPETLTKEENIDFFRRSNISFVAVDEAHCISEWGHDFRPEYRNIKRMIKGINDKIPVIALTATATPKVQSDIVKNLDMEDHDTYISSFNRDNLYYEVRPKRSKPQIASEIIKFIKKSPGKSGIIYVQARKTTEEIAKILQVNGINAEPYHAGLDAKTRTRVQDNFLMEELDVIVATIAFGMGIDKPDVRFVIHYDIPKSIENYYQETGRAGRDGIQSNCLAFYSYKDIMKLEKFLRDKPVAERELSAQLMEEIIGYAETSTCRRKFLLHYFGEEWPKDHCDDMCDNCKHPRDRIEVRDDMHKALKVVEELNEGYRIKTLVDYVSGKRTSELKEFKFDRHATFGVGSNEDPLHWHSIYRQAVLHNLLNKEIEQYGLLKLTDHGRAFVAEPWSIEIPMNRDFTDTTEEDIITNADNGVALDETLVQLLKSLRRTEAKRLAIQPWIIFSEPTLNDMATYYPRTIAELEKIGGVSAGKARKFGKAFVAEIADYVEANGIEPPTEIVIKQVANKSKDKVTIIQEIDRKMPLEDIARRVDTKMEEFLYELNAIVDSGTKLNIDYYLEENVDEDIVEEIFEYFHDAETDEVDAAARELQEEDITLEEVQLVRIKFMSEIAN